jgi:LPS sulfotransferase NodH
MSSAAAPDIVYLIAGTPRTGTTLLCEALAAAGAGEPAEWFSRAQLAKAGLSYLAAPGDSDRRRSIEACHGYLLRRLEQTCRNGVSGFKLHWHQLAQLMKAGTGEVVHELLAGRMLPARIHTVLVTRSPVDVQAVSVLQAYASGVFAVDEHGRQTILRYDDAFWGPPGVAAAARARLAAGDVYDYADLNRISTTIERANEQWRGYLHALAAPTTHVSYDDLASDLVSCTNTILADLAMPGLDAAYRPALLVQRDAATTAMLHRYRAAVSPTADKGTETRAPASGTR